VNGAAGTNRLTTVNSAGIARLLGTSLSDADVQMRFAIDQLPVGSGFWLNIVGRSVSSANEYRARVRFASTGLFVGAYRVVNGGASSVIGSEVATGLASTPGQFYRVRMNVSGANPTTIKIKVWLDGANEPANWLVSQTDASASIQSAGTVGVTTWMQGTTPLPLTFTFDDVAVRAANQAPIAVMSVPCTGLACDANGSASTDSDGSIVAYDWSFGDGGVATGPTPTTHVYATPGAYVVTLAVTDNNGLQTSATQVVNVS
jgi:PKD repeat protein